METVYHVCIIRVGIFPRSQNAVSLEMVILILRLPIVVVLSSAEARVAVCFSGVMYCALAS